MSHRLQVKDSVGEREVLLRRRILIGRDPQCDITDSDAQLSRRHAEFVVSDGAVVVRDLNSRNGMLVNGKKVPEAVLHPGDVVQVANLAVTFVSASAEGVVAVQPARPGQARTTMPATLPGLGASRDPENDQRVLPFRPSPEEDDRTRMMSADEAAQAAAASLSDRTRGMAPNGRHDGGRERAGAPASDPGRAAAAAEPLAPPRTALPGSSPASLNQPVPARAVAPAAAPAAAETGWTANLTWHVATLAIVAFLVGALSALPWRAGPIGSAPLAAAMVLLLPLVALLAALGLGLFVAARIRRATIARIAACAEQVRKAARGEVAQVADPLGTAASADLAGAINELLERSGSREPEGRRR